MTVAGSVSEPANHDRGLSQRADNTGDMVRRRRLLLGLATAAGVAGCTNASTESSPTTTDSSASGDTTTAETSATPPADLSAVTGGKYGVNVSAVSDGAVSAGDDRVEFTEPVRKTWNVVGYQGGTRVGRERNGSRTPAAGTDDEPPLVIGRTLNPTDDAQHGFGTPVYDAEAERFELWFYVDETYRAAHDTHYVVTGTSRRTDFESREAEFTEQVDGIYRTSVTYDRPVSADMAFPFGTLLDRPLAEVTPNTGQRPAYTAVGVDPRLERRRSAPQVAFSFEYDRTAETVTIAHDGGDSVTGSNLQVLIDGSPVTAFEGEVTAGDSTTVDVSGAASGARLRVVWEDDGVSATLAAFDLP